MPLTIAAWNILAEKYFVFRIAVFLLYIQIFLLLEEHNGLIMENKARIIFYHHAPACGY